MKCVEVTVSPIDIINSCPARVPFEWWAKQRVLGMLKDAGVPVVGHTELELTKGVLERIEDISTRDIRYRWFES